MKKLLAPFLLTAAGALLCASSAVLGQTTPEYDLSYHIFWNFGVPVTLNYSTLDAPPSAPRELVLKVLGRVEARFNQLNIPGLSVRIGRTDLAVNCDYRARNEVTICWENRQGETSNYQTFNRTDDVNYWHEGNIIMGKNTVWDEALLYEWISHHVMHFVGFSHPNEPGAEGKSVLHGAPDLMQMDIDALRYKYRADRCALTYDARGQINMPFVKYMGGGFIATLQYDGGTSFSLVPGSLGRYGSQAFNTPPPLDPSALIRIPVPAPATPCPALELDGNGELFIPEVKVNGVTYQATLKVNNGKFTVTQAAAK
jgi:hypothetical protein